MDSKKPFYKSIPFWIMVLLLLYSALGFFAVPFILKNKTKEIFITELNSTFTFENINFNPYSFSTTVKKVQLKDLDSTLWFSADSLNVDLNIWQSLFNNLSIQQVAIDNPYYNIITQNINDKTVVKYPKINNQNSKTDQQTFLLEINSFSINKGSIDYKDKSGKKQFDINIKQLDFNHQGFTTADAPSQFDLSFKTQNNDSTKLSGIFNFAQLKLDAKWQLKNWSTATVFTFIGDENNRFLGLINQDGTINATGDVKFKSSIKDQLFTLNIDELKLDHLKTIDDAQKQMESSAIGLFKATIDLVKNTVLIDSIILNDNLIELEFDKDNLMLGSGLIKPNQTSNPKTNKAKKWAYQISKIQANNSTIKIKKHHKQETSNNAIVFEKLDINSISSDNSKIIEINAQILSDKSGEISLTSKLQIQPLNIKAQINANNVDVTSYAAWMPEGIKIVAEKGKLSLQQNIVLTDNIESMGWIKLQNLSLTDQNKQPFFAIKQLDFEQFSLNSANKIIKLNNIKLDQAHGNLIFSANKKLNLSTLVDSKQSNKTQANNSKKTKDWTIQIDQVEFIDAQSNFIDKSIKPHFQTELNQVNGSIKGLSSNNLSKADIKLKGVLDKYGKIVIDGKINPLSEKTFTDLIIQISNLDLQNFSSYSAKFLGFPINRGKADFNLKYKLNQSILNGLNDFTFKQLKFGNKTASKDAVNLPLKLAVSLLTDSKGIMKVNMPVKGNIDDPEFSYGSLVFKAFFKLVTGIVASPFKLLVKLIPNGSDQDLSNIIFKAGSLELLHDEIQKLNNISVIMIKKPHLILELSSIANTIEDTKILKLKGLLSQLNLNSTPDFTQKSMRKIIQNTYENQFNETKWQDLINKSFSNAELDTQLLYQYAWDELLSGQDIAQQLTLLAKQRALNIQTQLIENQHLPQDRIFIKQGQLSQDLPPQVTFGIAQ